MNDVDLELLLELLTVDSPSGDEYRMAEWLTGWIGQNAPDADIVRLRDCLVAVKSESPRVAVFAHIDTNGFTVAQKRALVPIGSPKFAAKQPVRVIGQASSGTGTLSHAKDDTWKVRGLDCEPGDRLVYANSARQEGPDGIRLIAPYLDNRGGVWAALRALSTCDRIVVAFTTGEEMGGSGALMCSRYIWETWRIETALISDITWHTEHVRCGRGVALSLRDRMVPPQRFVSRVRALAEGSGIPYQIEIESAGGSDGSFIERSGYPIDWIFIGAPQKNSHGHDEEVLLTDMDAMAEMLKYLAGRLTDD